MAGDVIGRESELAILHSFLDSIPTGPSALLLSGDPGIGKTTVWKEGLHGARERGYRTLSCGPVEAETRLVDEDEFARDAKLELAFARQDLGRNAVEVVE